MKHEFDPAELKSPLMLALMGRLAELSREPPQPELVRVREECDLAVNLLLTMGPFRRTRRAMEYAADQLKLSNVSDAVSALVAEITALELDAPVPTASTTQARIPAALPHAEGCASANPGGGCDCYHRAFGEGDFAAAFTMLAAEAVGALRENKRLCAESRGWVELTDEKMVTDHLVNGGRWLAKSLQDPDCIVVVKLQLAADGGVEVSPMSLGRRGPRAPDSFTYWRFRRLYDLGDSERPEPIVSPAPPVSGDPIDDPQPALFADELLTDPRISKLVLPETTLGAVQYGGGWRVEASLRLRGLDDPATLTGPVEGSALLAMQAFKRSVWEPAIARYIDATMRATTGEALRSAFQPYLPSTLTLLIDIANRAKSGFGAGTEAVVDVRSDDTARPYQATLSLVFKGLEPLGAFFMVGPRSRTKLDAALALSVEVLEPALNRFQGYLNQGHSTLSALHLALGDRFKRLPSATEQGSP